MASPILTTHDRTVGHIATLEIRRESRQVYKPMTTTRDIWQKEPNFNKKSLSRRATAEIMASDTERRVQYAKGLRAPRSTPACKAAEIWSSAVLQLPPKVLSFAAQDTWPHNANLALWKKNTLLDACKLCGKRQTLPHVLNQCPIALKLRWYNVRHDAVLEVIEKSIRPHLSEGYSLLVDLPNFHPYTFPPNIAYTDLRPDLVPEQ